MPEYIMGRGSGFETFRRPKAAGSRHFLKLNAQLVERPNKAPIETEVGRIGPSGVRGRARVGGRWVPVERADRTSRVWSLANVA